MLKCIGMAGNRSGKSSNAKGLWRFALIIATVGISCFSVTCAAEQNRVGIAVCSTTQVADFVRQVVGDRWEVQSVLTPGSDPHTYQITPADVQLVKNATLCFENGLHLEGADWMKNLAADAGKKLVTCTDRIQPIMIEEEGQAVPVRDPHAWFDPANARIYVLNILDAVVAEDPDHEREYKARTELYLGQLRNLNAWIIKQVNALPRERRVLVTSHDAFNYFCKAYGFESAAPEGWSTGAEVGAGVTPASRAKAIESIRKFGVKSIFVETSVNPEVIKQMASEAGVQVGGSLYSDSMGPPGSAGETYLGMMRENVLTIIQALE